MASRYQVLLFCTEEIIHECEEYLVIFEQLGLTACHHPINTMPGHVIGDEAFEWGSKYSANESLWIFVTNTAPDITIPEKYEKCFGINKWQLIKIDLSGAMEIANDSESVQPNTNKLLHVLGASSLLLQTSPNSIPPETITSLIQSSSKLRYGIYRFEDGSNLDYVYKGCSETLSNIQFESRRLIGVLRYGRDITIEKSENILAFVGKMENQGKNMIFGIREDNSIRDNSCYIHFLVGQIKDQR